MLVTPEATPTSSAATAPTTAADAGAIASDAPTPVITSGPTRSAYETSTRVTRAIQA
jgi:hypothetical protein